MSKNDDKTNVMRIFDQKKVFYKQYHVELDAALSGVQMAALLGLDEARVFKTLVTVGKSGNHFVFVIPVAEELDLKKAAKTVGEKNIEMIHQKDLLPLTGYVHGGCSPVGMKKFYNTTFHKSALNFDTVFFSAGRIGFQVEVSLAELKKVISFDTADLVVDNI